MKLQYKKIGQLIYLVFKASHYSVEEDEEQENKFAVVRCKEVFVNKETGSFRFKILCFSPKEKGYEAMAENFGEFQKAIERSFAIKTKCDTGYEYFRTNVFVSEPLNLDVDNENQLFVMKTELTFNEISYDFKERE